MRHTLLRNTTPQPDKIPAAAALPAAGKELSPDKKTMPEIFQHIAAYTAQNATRNRSLRNYSGTYNRLIHSSPGSGNKIGSPEP